LGLIALHRFHRRVSVSDHLRHLVRRQPRPAALAPNRSSLFCLRSSSLVRLGELLFNIFFLLSSRSLCIRVISLWGSPSFNTRLEDAGPATVATQSPYSNIYSLDPRCLVCVLDAVLWSARCIGSFVVTTGRRASCAASCQALLAFGVRYPASRGRGDVFVFVDGRKPSMFFPCHGVWSQSAS